MQTFLPYSNFQLSASVLDNKRLGKQRVEGYQILQCLVGEKSGWKNHPAVKMWRGYEGALARYTIEMCRCWRGRGYKDTLLDRVMQLCNKHGIDWLSLDKPWWLGREEFHRSHRQTLLSKNPTFYSDFGWKELPIYEYWWPTEHEDNNVQDYRD